MEAAFIDAEQGKVTVRGYVHPNTIIMKLEKSGKQAELWGPTMKSFGHNNFKNSKVSDIEFDDFDRGMKKMKSQQKSGKGFKDMSVNLAPKAPKSVKFEFGESDGELGDESDGFDVDFGRRQPPRTPGRGGGKNGVVIKKVRKAGIFRVLLRRLLGKSKGKGGKGGKKAARSGGGHGGKQGGGKNGDWMMESGKNGGKNMNMVVAKNGGNGAKKSKNLDFEIDVGNPKKGARGGGGGGGQGQRGGGGGGYSQGGGGGASGHHKGGSGGGYNGQGRTNIGGNIYGVGGHGGDSAINGGSNGGGRFAGQTNQMGHPQMMGNHQMDLTSTHQMAQMGHSMGQMGNHQVAQMGYHSMGQMGNPNYSAVPGLLAPTMMNGGGGGYYQGMVAPTNPYNQPYNTMMMNQQRMQGNGTMYHPLVYDRRPNPIGSYDPPRPSGGYTHMFSDENTESCSIM